ncbi:MAG TPA: M3 family metallopeptidase [Patescibacteria group bacterium]|nr:M3 family metallopeptidase [Patescibacteria group bacterium]
MTETNPLLSDDEFVAYSEIRPEQVLPAVQARIAAYRARIEALVADVGQHRFDGLMLAWEECEDALNRCFAPVGHLHNVCDTPALREVYGEAIELLTDFGTEIGQHAGLCAAVRSIRARADFDALPATARKLVDDALLDFRLAGVDLPADRQQRFAAIATELSRLTTEFEQAVLDATEAWTLDVPDGDARLRGLPDSALAQLKQAAQDAQVDGSRISLQPPVYQAVMMHADDRALRERVYTAYQTRASDQGPNAGRFDNGPRIERILALRHEAAQLLGFANAAEESLATKMAETPERVLHFLRDLAARAKPVAEREIAELAEFARTRLGIASLEPWDVSYASEKMRIERYALSEEELKPYFPLERVMAGLYALTERVFGVTLVERKDVDLWHRDARCFDLIDARGSAFAVVYLDLFARSGKRGGAWMDVARARKRIGPLQRPHAFLTCNFAPPTAALPSLLTHDDVLTLFHEFGHGLHHLLTEIDYPSLSGIEGVEWDAVELPSQFMENFGWHRETLNLIAAHWQTGAPLPDALFQRMLAAKHFQAGLFLVRQLEFALFDFRLHREFDPARGARVQEMLAEVRREVAVIHPPLWQRFPNGFTHVFSGGYAAGYYSYLWAEVLSADAFSRFEAEGITNVATGRDFRAEVLAVGGSRPALDSFVAFRGREPDPAALLRSYGLAA